MKNKTSSHTAKISRDSFNLSPNCIRPYKKISKDLDIGQKCKNTDTIPITIYRSFTLINIKLIKNYNHWLLRMSYTKNTESIGDTLHHNTCNKIVKNKQFFDALYKNNITLANLI